MENSPQRSEYPYTLSDTVIRSGANTIRTPNGFPARLERAQRSRSVTSRRGEHGRRRRRITNQQQQQQQQSSQIDSTNKRRRVEEQGQVEMAQIPLKLQFCDGGRYDGDQYCYYASTDHCPENALRNDSSVYCTKNSRCNMILQHTDGKCFTLQKLVIRAPPSGYTSPNSVREGMIFVTMDNENLIARTNYSIRYEDYSGDDEDDSGDEIGHHREARSRQIDPCDVGQGERESQPLFEPQPLFESSTVPGVFYRGRTANNLRNTDAGPSRIEAAPDVTGNFVQTPLLEPHATFFDRDQKNKCVINFEPAISGRFILAKFFAAHMDDNIDIEFIGAYGFVGRRFFPAIAPR